MSVSVEDGSAVCLAMGRAARHHIDQIAHGLGISQEELSEMQRGTEPRELCSQAMPDAIRGARLDEDVKIVKD